MRIAVALLVLVSSCKKNPCEQAGDHMFGAIAKHTAAWLSLDPDEMDQAKASLVEDCKMRPWDDGASSCIGRAIDAKDLEGCAGMQNVESWRVLVMGQVDPNGQKRYPEVDALIAELKTADAAVGGEPGVCKGALPVVAIDRAIIGSLSMKRPLPEKAELVGESFTVALSRYELEQQVTAYEMIELRKWIKALPKDHLWGIVETDSRVAPESKDATTFIEGEYLGTIHVVDGAKKTALCQRAFGAHSSESVKTYFVGKKQVIGIEDQLRGDLRKNIDSALAERLAKLTKGDPDPTAEVAKFRADLVAPNAVWNCTQNTQVLGVNLCDSDVKACERLRAGKGDEYMPCKKYDEVWCLSFHDKLTDRDMLACHGSPDSCGAARRYTMIDGDGIEAVSRCQKLPLDQQTLGEQKQK